MDELTKRRMYTVIVREQKGKGIPRSVEIDTTPVADFYWNIGYKYSLSADEKARLRSGLPKPATENPETAMRKAWRDLVKKGAFIFWIEAFVESEQTSKDVMRVVFDTEDCHPMYFNQLVTQKSEVVSCPK